MSSYNVYILYFMKTQRKFTIFEEVILLPAEAFVTQVLSPPPDWPYPAESSLAHTAKSCKENMRDIYKMSRSKLTLQIPPGFQKPPGASVCGLPCQVSPLPLVCWPVQPPQTRAHRASSLFVLRVLAPEFGVLRSLRGSKQSSSLISLISVTNDDSLVSVISLNKGT